MTDLEKRSFPLSTQTTALTLVGPYPSDPTRLVRPVFSMKRIFVFPIHRGGPSKHHCSCQGGSERGITVTLPTWLFVAFHPETITGRLVMLCNPRTLRIWAPRANLHRDGNAIPLCGRRPFSAASETPSLAPTSLAGSPISTPQPRG